MRQFSVGDVVTCIPDMFLRYAAPGDYKIVAAMPDRDGDHIYRIKSPLEEHERVVKGKGKPSRQIRGLFAGSFKKEATPENHIAHAAGSVEKRRCSLGQTSGAAYFVSATKIPVQSAGGALVWKACMRVRYKSNSIPSPKLCSADRHNSIASNAPSQSRLR